MIDIWETDVVTDLISEYATNISEIVSSSADKKIKKDIIVIFLKDFARKFDAVRDEVRIMNKIDDAKCKLCGKKVMVGEEVLWKRNVGIGHIACVDKKRNKTNA
jgi:acetyltransferase-like isoleucine patch superfamily enzyme